MLRFNQLCFFEFDFHKLKFYNYINLMFTLIDPHRIRESQNILSWKEETRMIKSNSHLYHFSFGFPTRIKILFDLLFMKNFHWCEILLDIFSFFSMSMCAFCVYQFLSQLTRNTELTFCQTCYISNFLRIMNVQGMDVSSYEECFFKRSGICHESQY